MFSSMICAVGNVPFDECGGSRTAAECLEAERASAGEQVDRVAAAAAGADQVKNCLAGAVLHWPNERVAVIIQTSPAELAADDANVDVLISGKIAATCWWDCVFWTLRAVSIVSGGAG